MMILQQVAAVLGLLVVYRLYSNWKQLSNGIPGPLIARYSDLYRAYQQYNGKLRDELVRLHSVHGPVVRYGVRSVSISDPSVVDVVYGSRAGFTTADSYNVLVGIANGKEVASLVSTRDETRHGALRRSVASAFTPTGVLDYEPWIDESIVELLDVLSERPLIDLSTTMLYYSMDAAGRFSFSESLGCLRADADEGGVASMIRNRFNHWGWWSSLPGLERLIYRNPIALRMKRAPSSMAASAVAKMKARAGKPSNSSRAPDLLSRFMESSQTNPEVLDTAGIVGMLMSTISGAGDTTATSTTAILYYLLQHRDKLAKLRAELVAADINKSLPSNREVSKLPYLHATIREGMRLFPTITWPIERCVPKGGAIIAGMHFHEGTSVGCMPAALHLNPAVFGEDAREYRPERWLVADPEVLRKMESSHMGLSRGRRVCLGQHIAMMQMKKVVAAMVLNFDMSLSDPTSVLDADFSPAVACLKPLMIKVVPKHEHGELPFASDGRI
ncbi:hypothetical protein LTR22_007909 [Elasticomyces elasticus]|nr:hypothetical protein LTR22_007909 [Elasticomyces elasticus]